MRIFFARIKLSFIRWLCILFPPFLERVFREVKEKVANGHMTEQERFDWLMDFQKLIEKGAWKL